ncbi:GAF and ANTAR domain-containing protein [Leifsonia poae]|uniref:Transcriptional regulator n=1 Tax=Leifsonia poae TaxID=110933 RepID=A0A9W6LZL4_9MICO|nr:GAF and ANTAR domain-containing protein [Leifsonia poae]GLJ76363.1 transcriptional regulator [Leifsonia poae]
MKEDIREAQLLESFATLADTLVAGYDILDLLQTLVERCQALLTATQAGILLADGNGSLDVVASTDERSQLIELMQLGPDGGPCVECYVSGHAVSVPSIDDLQTHWTSFRDAALAQGFHSIHAFPLRLRNVTIGSLNLFRDEQGELDKLDTVAAQAMADVATIGILQERAVAEGDVIRSQLQRALDSRVIIEQAKGVISYRHRIPVDEAFNRIRGHARSQQLPLTAVARDIVERRLAL